MRRRPILSSLAIVSLAFGAGCAGSPDIHGSGGAGGEGGRSSDATTGSHHSAGGGGQGGNGGAGGGANCGDGVCGADESCKTCSADCGACCAGGACCGNGTCDPGESCSTCPQDCKDDGGNACPRVGMFYLGWHQPAWNAVQQTKALGKPVLTVEDVIRSRVAIGAPPGPVYTFDQILNANGLAGVAGNFYYQATPKSGPYCIVHQREPGSLNYDATHEGNYGSGAVPDCPGYEATLKRQAAELVSAGVDFIVTDQTNIADFSPFGDAIQLRPFEVVIEEWRALRKKGVKTPDVAGWQRMAQPGTMLPHVLAVYNAPENDRMMLRDSASGKKILFYPDVTDVDAGLVAMAAANGGKNDILPVPMWVNRQAQGSWSFFAQCQQGANLDDGACAQAPTTNSVVGSQLAVTPSYQLGYASLPVMAPGVFHGLTFRKQFETAFAVKPHWLFMSGYNEQIAQPQPNAPGVSMGLETDPTINGQAFVDTYGVEFSRDIEPSKEYGSLVYDLMASCLRVYRAGRTTCDKPDEACCKGGNFSDRYARFDGAGGPFVVYATALGMDPSRSALYQCRAGAADDFFSSDPACEGTTVVAQVGFMSTVKGGETLRSLLRCFGTGGHAYSLVATCPAGKNPEAVLGYVR